MKSFVLNDTNPSVHYLANSNDLLIVRTEDNISQSVFDKSNEIFSLSEVENCHPEFVTKRKSLIGKFEKACESESIFTDGA